MSQGPKSIHVVWENAKSVVPIAVEHMVVPYCTKMVTLPSCELKALAASAWL